MVKLKWHLTNLDLCDISMITLWLTIFPRSFHDLWSFYDLLLFSDLWSLYDIWILTDIWSLCDLWSFHDLSVIFDLSPACPGFPLEPLPSRTYTSIERHPSSLFTSFSNLPSDHFNVKEFSPGEENCFLFFSVILSITFYEEGSQLQGTEATITVFCYKLCIIVDAEPSVNLLLTWAPPPGGGPIPRSERISPVSLLGWDYWGFTMEPSTWRLDINLWGFFLAPPAGAPRWGPIYFSSLTH